MGMPMGGMQGDMGMYPGMMPSTGDELYDELIMLARQSGGNGAVLYFLLILALVMAADQVNEKIIIPATYGIGNNAIGKAALKPDLKMEAFAITKTLLHFGRTQEVINAVRQDPETNQAYRDMLSVSQTGAWIAELKTLKEKYEKSEDGLDPELALMQQSQALAAKITEKGNESLEDLPYHLLQLTAQTTSIDKIPRAELVMVSEVELSKQMLKDAKRSGKIDDLLEAAVFQGSRKLAKLAAATTVASQICGVPGTSSEAILTRLRGQETRDKSILRNGKITLDGQGLTSTTNADEFKKSMYLKLGIQNDSNGVKLTEAQKTEALKASLKDLSVSELSAMLQESIDSQIAKKTDAYVQHFEVLLTTSETEARRVLELTFPQLVKRFLDTEQVGTFSKAAFQTAILAEIKKDIQLGDSAPNLTDNLAEILMHENVEIEFYKQNVDLQKPKNGTLKAYVSTLTNGTERLAASVTLANLEEFVITAHTRPEAIKQKALAQEKAKAGDKVLTKLPHAQEMLNLEHAAILLEVEKKLASKGINTSLLKNSKILQTFNDADLYASNTSERYSKESDVGFLRNISAEIVEEFGDEYNLIVDEAFEAVQATPQESKVIRSMNYMLSSINAKSSEVLFQQLKDDEVKWTAKVEDLTDDSEFVENIYATLNGTSAALGTAYKNHVNTTCLAENNLTKLNGGIAFSNSSREDLVNFVSDQTEQFGVMSSAKFIENELGTIQEKAMSAISRLEVEREKLQHMTGGHEQGIRGTFIRDQLLVSPELAAETVAGALDDYLQIHDQAQKMMTEAQKSPGAWKKYNSKSAELEKLREDKLNSQMYTVGTVQISLRELMSEIVEPQQKRTLEQLWKANKRVEGYNAALQDAGILSAEEARKLVTRGLTSNESLNRIEELRKGFVKNAVTRYSMMLENKLVMDKDTGSIKAGAAPEFIHARTADITRYSETGEVSAALKDQLALVAKSSPEGTKLPPENPMHQAVEILVPGYQDIGKDLNITKETFKTAQLFAEKGLKNFDKLFIEPVMIQSLNAKAQESTRKLFGKQLSQESVAGTIHEMSEILEAVCSTSSSNIAKMLTKEKQKDFIDGHYESRVGKSRKNTRTGRSADDIINADTVIQRSTVKSAHLGR